MVRVGCLIGGSLKGFTHPPDCCKWQKHLFYLLVEFLKTSFTVSRGV